MVGRPEVIQAAINRLELAIAISPTDQIVSLPSIKK
jgi:hypothetical protein